MQILISGRGVNLTDPIEDYVTKKINSLDKFFKDIIRADVILGLETRHRVKGKIFFAECKLGVPGYDVFTREAGTTLYEAIDLIKAKLEKDLKKHKIKLRGNEKKNRQTRRRHKEYAVE